MTKNNQAPLGIFPSRQPSQTVRRFVCSLSQTLKARSQTWNRTIYGLIRDSEGLIGGGFSYVEKGSNGGSDVSETILEGEGGTNSLSRATLISSISLIPRGVRLNSVFWCFWNVRKINEVFDNLRDKEYHIAVILLVYVLPLTVMFVTYSAIGIILWHNDVPGDHTNMVYYQHKIVAKKKFVRAMVAVVITFAICWFPYHFYFILGSVWKEVNRQKYIQQVYLAVFLLAMSSAMYSPIIYCCLNHRFRSGFKIAFQWCPCIKATERDRLNLGYPDPYGKSKENKHPTSL